MAAPPGASIETFEWFVKNHFPKTVHDRVAVEVYGWDRVPAGKAAYGIQSPIASFPIAATGWYDLCDRHRKYAAPAAGPWSTPKIYEEVGIGAKLVEFDNMHWTSVVRGYLCFVDFLPGLEKGGRAVDAFYEALERIKGRKFYVFDSGSAHHGFLNLLTDLNDHSMWLQFLKAHPQVVDQKWVKFADNNTHGGVLRISQGRSRPVPRLTRWVNL